MSDQDDGDGRWGLAAPNKVLQAKEMSENERLGDVRWEEARKRIAAKPTVKSESRYPIQIRQSTCPGCGYYKTPVSSDSCYQCGRSLINVVSSEPAELGPIVVFTYRGKQQSDTTEAFRSDAARLATKGYFPTTQNWSEGQYGCGDFILALLLCFLLVGFLVFIYMLIVKPDGTLTVTYTLQTNAPPHVPTVSGAPTPGSSVLNTNPLATSSSSPKKTCPDCGEEVQEIARICRFCRYEFK